MIHVGFIPENFDQFKYAEHVGDAFAFYHYYTEPTGLFHVNLVLVRMGGLTYVCKKAQACHLLFEQCAGAQHQGSLGD